MDAVSLIFYVDRPHQAWVLSGNSDWTAIGVTDLRLDTSGGHHHRSGTHHEVSSLDQPLDDVVASSYLAGSTQSDVAS